ncbi:MAG: hypothetical protein Q8Q35_00930 [Nanoarchaeota archaeon]|nr:hypothetical protein [Nanoarchaeota archaeon]
MNSVWFKDLGFYNNPFSIKPAAFHDNVLGYEKVIDEISYGILNNNVIVVEGEYGNGKSSILRRLLNDFGGKKQVIYYSCNRIEARLNFKKLLNGRYGFFGNLFDMKPKDMILLLDEAQELSEKDYQKLYSYYQEGYFKSVVLVGKDIETKRIIKEFKPILKEIKLDEIDETTAVKVIRKRIGDIDILSNEMIKKIFKASNNNVRLLLKNCEEACRFALERGKVKVDNDVLTKVLGIKSETEERSSKPLKVNIPNKKETEEVEEEEDEEEDKKDVKVKTKAKKKSLKEDTKPTKAEVYNPDRYKDMLQSSTEELLNKGTDELFE